MCLTELTENRGQLNQLPYRSDVSSLAKILMTNNRLDDTFCLSSWRYSSLIEAVRVPVRAPVPVPVPVVAGIGIGINVMLQELQRKQSTIKLKTEPRLAHVFLGRTDVV